MRNIIRSPLIVLCLTLGFVGFVTTLQACNHEQRDTLRTVALDVADCSKGSAHEVAQQLSPLAEAAIRNATGDGGRVDVSKLRASASGLKDSLLRCAFMTAVREVATRGLVKLAEGVQSESNDPNPAELVDAAERIRVEDFGGTTFVTAGSK